MDAAENQSADRRRIAILLLLATLLHGWMLLQTHVPARDTIGYVRYALLLEQLPWRDALPRIEQHPLYPASVLAMSLPLRHFLGTSPDTMVWSAQAVSGLAAVLLVLPMFYLGRALFDSRVGFWSAALFQVLPVSTTVTSDGLSDGLLYLWVMTALACAVWGMGRHRKKGTGTAPAGEPCSAGNLGGAEPVPFFLCGVAVGLAYLTRPEGALAGVAVGLVLLVMRLVQWSWGRVAVNGGALTVAALLVAGPYMAAIGGVTVKPSGKKWLGLEQQAQETPAPPVQSNSGQPLFAVWWSNRVEPAPLPWAVGAVCRETVRAWQHVFWLPTLLGLWWWRGQWRSMAAWPIFVLCLVHLSVLMRMALLVGYVSERHCLFLVLLLSPWTATGALRITDMLAGLAPRLPRLRTALPAAALLALLPWAAQSLHANREGYKEAGYWLAQHAQPGDEIVDPFCWAHYYAGAVLREGQVFPPTDQRVRYVVLENSSNPHARLTLLPAQELAERGRVVFRWTPTGRGWHKAEEVVVYAVSENTGSRREPEQAAVRPSGSDFRKGEPMGDGSRLENGRAERP